MIVAMLILIVLVLLFPGLMRALAVLLFIGTLMVMSHAKAQDDGAPLPIYDVDHNCKSNVACVQSEQRDYDYLRAVWGGLLPITRTRAVLKSQATAGYSLAYGMLKEWVESYARYDEDAAAHESAKQGFKP